LRENCKNKPDFNPANAFLSKKYFFFYGRLDILTVSLFVGQQSL